MAITTWTPLYFWFEYRRVRPTQVRTCFCFDMTSPLTNSQICRETVLREKEQEAALQGEQNFWRKKKKRILSFCQNTQYKNQYSKLMMQISSHTNTIPFPTNTHFCTFTHLLYTHTHTHLHRCMISSCCIGLMGPTL